MTAEIKPTNCHYCGYLCAFNATVEDGRIVALEPDTSRYPYDESILAGCQRWKMNIPSLESDERINYPLKRIGERGSGQFERISWDVALDDIATRLGSLRAKHGAGTLASMIGGPHTSFWPLHRFMSNFGSPNNMGIGQICWNPRIWMDAITFGWTIEADITPATNTLLVWGTNPAESDNSAFWRSLLKMSKVASPKIIVIDPRYTKTARIADKWIAPSPGTDCTLVLAMINVIISEHLYDSEFVDKWCYGFDELVEHIQAYTPEYASEVTGVSADDIVEIARDFAKSPSAIVSGRGIDQVGKNVLPTHRARCILLAITGNLDKPGANFIAGVSDFVEELDLEQTLPNFETLKANSLNEGTTALQSYSGYAQILDITKRLGLRLPARYLASAHPDLVLNAIESGEPYPVTALIVEATNPVLTYADTHRVYAALNKLELIVVLDYFLTPTAAMADYILPAAAAMERPTFQAHGGVANMAYGGPAAVSPYFERKVDYEIFRELGLRLGQVDLWPDATFEDAIASTLAPTGLDWEGYCAYGMYALAPTFFKHEQLDENGHARGFATTTGKVELASLALEALGGDRLPRPSDNRRLCSDQFVSEKEREGWVHVGLMTGARKQPYNASMYLNNDTFRERYPEPLVEMSQATAEKIGAQNGDWVILATDNGECRLKVSIINMVDDYVQADYGWWFPERINDDTLGGAFEHNINTLTSCSLDQAEPLIGTWSYNAMDCMMSKRDAPNCSYPSSRRCV